MAIEKRHFFCIKEVKAIIAMNASDLLRTFGIFIAKKSAYVLNPTIMFGDVSRET